MKKYTERHINEVIRNKFRIEMNMPAAYPPIPARHTSEGGVRDRFFAAKAELPKEITVVHPFNVDAFEKSNALTVFVSPEGNDGGDGSEKSPLLTLGAALDRVKGKKGGKIVLRGGEYRFTEPTVIGREHSGSEDSPLIITAAKGEKPRITGSYAIPTSAFTGDIAPEMLKRLKPEAREHIVVADLGKLGITEYGIVGNGGTSLVQNNEPMQLCRYPNAGEPAIMMSETVYNNGSRESGEGWEIPTPENMPGNWMAQDDMYVYGALAYEWEHAFMRLREIDLENGRIKSAEPSPYSCPIQPRGGNSYYFLNVFEELDAPSEWYLDRKTGLLYFWPKYPLEGSEINLITSTFDLIRVHGAEYVLIDGLELGRSSGAVLDIRDSFNVLGQRLYVCSTSSSYDGCSAINIIDGKKCGVVDSRMEHFASRVVSVQGGNRKELEPANNFFQNNVITNSHCRMGLSCAGCGNVISHNYIKDTTMSTAGNEDIVEYNVFEGGDHDTHDSGMIYIGGGGSSTAGDHYRYNYLFKSAKGDYGIYFDDLSRGMYAYGNIVVGNGQTAPGEWFGGGRSFNVHNGCEHCFYNNISIDAGYFAFGGDITYYLFDANWFGLIGGITGVAHNMNTEKFFGRNPTYRDYCAELFQYEEDRKKPDYTPHSSAAEERLRKPYANNYENNVIIRAWKPFKLDNGEESATSLETNYITEEDPGFVDMENGDYRLREDSEVFEKIPGFTPPPFERMGPLDE